MRHPTLLPLCIAIALTSAATPAAEQEPVERGQDAAPRLHGHLPRPESPPADTAIDTAIGDGSDLIGAASTSAQSAPGAMKFHGGKVMTQVHARVVFVGAQWQNAAFAGDKIRGLDTFFKGYGGSAYARLAAEYSGHNGQPTATLSYQGHVVDVHTELDPVAHFQAVTDYVCRTYRGGGFQADTAGNQAIYLYSDRPRAKNSGYCGFHTEASCSGHLVQYAWIYSVDSDPSCSTRDTVTGHSGPLASLANITAHETHEMRTNPGLVSWYDSAGNEVADKCAWVFAHSYVTFANNVRWKLQAEWSNEAFNAGTGTANASGQKGCLD